MTEITVEGKRYIYQTSAKVRFCETDANQHVSHVSYLIYFEQARTEFLESLSAYFKWWDSDYTVVLARQAVSYRAPAYYGQLLDIYTGVARIGRSSLDLYYLIRRRDQEEILTVGDSTVVLVNFATQRSAPWPDSFRQQVAQLLTPTDDSAQ